MDFEKVENSFEPRKDKKCSESSNGMIATAFPKATWAGQEILKAGGNAVDAACAASFALGVSEPQASGLGGQTMMLISNNKKVIAIDGSSRAPSLAHVNAIYKKDRAQGYRATTVPSTLATLSYVHQKYGNLSWQQILEPAISIAKEGYVITDLQNRLQTRELEKFNSIESKSGSYYFLKNGLPYKPGDLFKQKDLSQTLSKISKQGIDCFYSGTIAKQIDADMRQYGGLLRYDDLTLVPWPIERQPIKKRFRKFLIYSMPPPGAGRTLIFTLMMLNHLKPKSINKNELHRYYILAEIFRKALLDRSDRPYDPNFYPQVSGLDILNNKYAKNSIKEINRSTNINLPIKETIDEYNGETTHLSVIDKNGMAVSLTQSIERVYGSKAAAGGLGFLYNNYLMDFEYSIPSHPFYLRPNAVPWATVAPTLIFNNDSIWMAVGSPGSERIFSSISQFLIHVIDESMPIGEAMIAPRMHCSLGGRISIESDRFSDNIVPYLEKKGYRINKKEPYSFYLGAIHAVMKNHHNKGFQGVAEIRRDGTAEGI